MNLAAREVTLAKHGERIVFDVSQDWYRVAYYRPKRKLERAPDGTVISSSIVGEERFTAKKRIGRKDANALLEALTIVFGEAECKFDPLTVEQYLRSTSWGRQLP